MKIRTLIHILIASFLQLIHFLLEKIATACLSIANSFLKAVTYSKQKSKSRNEKLKMHSSWSFEKNNLLKFVEIVMISASHLAPTTHILVVIISKHIQRDQVKENKYNLCW